MSKDIAEVTKERRGLIPSRPFGDVSRWEQDMERFFENFLGAKVRPMDERWWSARSSGIPAVDLYEENGDIVAKADLPGLTREDVQINITDHLLTIKGEKKQQEEEREKDYYRSERLYGAFARTLPLPTEINPQKVRATFKNGVLEVRLPKSDEAKKKEIKVRVE
jgi:HSP20 family protein